MLLLLFSVFSSLDTSEDFYKKKSAFKTSIKTKNDDVTMTEWCKDAIRNTQMSEVSCAINILLNFFYKKYLWSVISGFSQGLSGTQK